MSAKKGLLVLVSLVGMVPKVQAAGYPTFARVHLDDVEGSWAEEAVWGLYERGIIIGFPDGTFRGDEPLNRYAAAALLWRAYLAWAEEVTKTLQEGLDRHEMSISEILKKVGSLEEGLAFLEEKTRGLGEMEVAVEEIRGVLEKLKVDLAGLESKTASREEVEELKADLAELVGEVASREEVEGLKEDLIRLVGEVASREEVGEIMNALASLEDTLSRQNVRLEEFEKRLNALDGTLNERKAEAERMAERVNALEKELKTFEEKVQQEEMKRPRFGVRFGGGPNAAEAFVFASTPDGKLKGGLTERGLEVDGEALPVRFTYRDGEGLLAYRLFSGVYLEPGLGGGGGTYFLQGRLVHDASGGLVPGLYLEGIGRYTLPISGTNPSLAYGVKLGYRFGEVFPTLAYYSTDYSALEGSLTWRANGFSLFGAYRFLAKPNGTERGGQGVVEIRTANERPNEGRVYVAATLSYAKGVTNGEPLSFGRPYRFTNTESLDWRLVVGYEVGW